MKSSAYIVANGTSWHGHRVRATYSQIVAILGAPHYENIDKSNFEWNVENAEGRACTVYDWCYNYWHIMDGNPIYWNIGARDAKSSELLEQELNKILS